MEQQLIVEGNDAIPLANLCRKAGLKPPVGYEIPEKFKKDFVKNAGGFDKAIALFEQALKNANINNIGLIVDANDAGYESRKQRILDIIASEFGDEVIHSSNFSPVHQILTIGSLTVGFWIMPDNTRNGYLEHFLADMIPSDDPLWLHTKATIADLAEAPFNELTAAKVGKAALHTWLAWKKEPGKPYGQAIEAGYLTVDPVALKPFLDWFSGTFRL